MIRLLLCLSLLLSGLAQAATIDLGNVAPSSGQIRLEIGGAPPAPALRYLQFVRVERELGPIEVVAYGADDHVLARGRFTFESRPGVAAMLVLIGNGSQETPYDLRFFDGVNDDDRSKSETAVSASVHHFAPIPGITTSGGFEVSSTCTHLHNNGLGGGSAGDGIYAYGRSASQVYSEDATYTCRLRTAHPSFGSFDLEVSPVEGTLRFLLVGDGVNEPQRVLILQNGVVTRVAAETAPAVASVIRSTAFWFDVARPAQGVSLYELKDSDDVFGTWFTHDDAGQPIWYLLDGMATGVPGQRDLTVRSPSRVGSVARLGTMGTARLFYIDCNQAELRVLLDRDYYTLRLKRSREVVSCDAFQAPQLPLAPQ